MEIIKAHNMSLHATFLVSSLKSIFPLILVALKIKRPTKFPYHVLACIPYLHHLDDAQNNS